VGFSIAAVVVVSDVVVGGVRLDVDEVSPDEHPEHIDTVSDSNPKFRVGPVLPSITLRCFVSFSTFGGFHTLFGGIHSVTLGIGRDSRGIIDGAISDSSSFVCCIFECVFSCVNSVTESITLCHSRHSEESG